MTRFTVNFLTKKVIEAYRQHRFDCIALNGIALAGRDIKLYILVQPEDTEKNFLVYSWKYYEDRMWKMEWDITVSKEGIVHDNSHS
jgi:hypothetical protein